MCQIQNPYWQYWSFNRLLVLNGKRNANDMKKAENDTNKNWNKCCFVTNGDENNVYNLKPQ